VLIGASGPLRIYRVTSSNVSFLNSGNLLHTIFPRSQCWCVDGESIFVLRIRQDTYYRIELPYDSAEDKERVEQFKTVLGQVLQYERTPCPFTRGFKVELPERSKTPPPRKVVKKPTGKAKKWLFDKKWVPEDGPKPSTAVPEASDSGTTSSYEEDDTSSVNTDSSEVIPDAPAATIEVTPLKPATQPTPAPSVSDRAKMFQGLRSATVPTAMNSQRVISSTEPIPEEASDAAGGQEAQVGGPTTKVPLERKESADAQSISTTDSFYSLESSMDGTPSPPYLDAETELTNLWAGEESFAQEELVRGRSQHRRQVSELTVKAPSEHRQEDAPVTPTYNVPLSGPTVQIHPSSAPSTPPLVSDSEDNGSLSPASFDVATPPDAIRMRRLTGASQKRAFSPMPHPQNLFRPPSHSTQKQFTTALIRKTAEIVLGPPSHLVNLMLRIAAKISDGIFGFKTYHVRQTNENIPGSWESSDEEDWAEEDDFGIPLRALDDSTTRRTTYSRDVD